MWNALAEAAGKPGISVRVYVDAEAAKGSGSPNASEVTAHLEDATVLRTRRFDGKAVRNRTKPLVIDHRFLIAGSANLFFSAERLNIQGGFKFRGRVESLVETAWGA